MKKIINQYTIDGGILVIALTVVCGSILFHLIEGWALFDSLYFIVITLTTIGYGDIIPLTIGGKIITMFFAVMGVPFFIFLAGYVMEKRISATIKEHLKQEGYALNK